VVHDAGIVRADWQSVVRELSRAGWVRIEAAVPPSGAVALEEAAPGPWAPVPENEGDAGVRQAGLACHADVDTAPDVVRRLAEAVRIGIDHVCQGVRPPVPRFNHAQWSRTDQGRSFITRHRDPGTAGGVIAIVTIRGTAVFRVWDDDVHEWETADGDLVLLCGGGWPSAGSRCPVHEAGPAMNDRVTLTLRHNKGGFGADYFDNM
jgi:hypothetical protein